MDLAHDIHVEPKSFFHTLQGLIQKGLAVKAPILAPNKGGSATHMATNIVFLPRFAPNMDVSGCRRLVGGAQGGAGPGEWLVSDDEGTMERVSRCLAEQESREMLESDLKVACGFVKVAGHRAWRRIRSKMEAEGSLQVAPVRIHPGTDRERVVSVARLLRPFARGGGGGGEEEEEPPRATLQPVAELSLSRQIVDHIALGEDVSAPEVWRALNVGGKLEAKLLTTLEGVFGLKKSLHGAGRTSVFLFDRPEEICHTHSRLNPGTVGAVRGWQAELRQRDARLQGREESDGDGQGEGAPPVGEAPAPAPAPTPTPAPEPEPEPAAVSPRPPAAGGGAREPGTGPKAARGNSNRFERRVAALKAAIDARRVVLQVEMPRLLADAMGQENRLDRKQVDRLVEHVARDTARYRRVEFDRVFKSAKRAKWVALCTPDYCEGFTEGELE